MTDELRRLFEPYVWAWFSQTFDHPTPPQVASWPKIAEGRNTLIFSPTGSGKTLAAFLWALNELFRMGREERLEDTVYVLYVSPLKALNNDIQRNLVRPLRGIRTVAEDMGMVVPEVRSAVRTGDTTRRRRAAMARRPPHVFITTPESLYIILATEKFREAFRSVKYVIVDEIHAVSDNKRGVHLALSLERLEHLARTAPGEQDQVQTNVTPGAPSFVRVGLSATQNPLDEIAKFLVGMDDEGRPRPCEIVDIGGRKRLDVAVISPVDNLLEAHFDAIWGSTYDYLLRMIREHETTLAFTNSRYKTERTALRLQELSDGADVAIGAHHGSMSKRVRLSAERKLKRGQLDALIATSSLELGIDVGSIDLVCQIQSPKSVSSGMQRIGRAGHLLSATSKGRLLVTDRDDLVESVVLARAILDGRIDTTRVPQNCLDVLAQQVVGAVAADPWDADAFYDLCCHAYPFHTLTREAYDRVLGMLSGDYQFDMEYPPYPKITWDKVNNVLYPEPAARMIAFRAGGTIPDITQYDVYFQARKTVVGRLGEAFVEELHVGDIFILGSSSWRVLRIHRNRVIVEDVYGMAPTIPFWYGERASRTYDLGRLVGHFRRTAAERLQLCAGGADDGELLRWLEETYHINEDGARGLLVYFQEQAFSTGDIPSDELILIEHFRDELGQPQVVIHSPFGIRVHDPWAMALCEAFEEEHGVRPGSATVDDGILLSFPQDADVSSSVLDGLLALVTPENLDGVLERALVASPVFKSRFRHNAVRSMMVLRQYKGRRTPVWLQGLRASALLEVCQSFEEFPLITETLRECMYEALDVPNLRRVLQDLAAGDIRVTRVKTRIPSPFTHSLMLMGQYGELGSIPTQERRSRLMHLHRELLRQILDEETLRHLLDDEVVAQVDARLQRRGDRRARTSNELARVLVDLGDLVVEPDSDISLRDRVALTEEDVTGSEDDPARAVADELLDQLVSDHRAVLVAIPTAETHSARWIATENFPLYRAAFGSLRELDDGDRALLDRVRARGPSTLMDLKPSDDLPSDLMPRLERLVRSYHAIRVVRDWHTAYAAADDWIPSHIRDQTVSRQAARLALVRKFARWHGPFTKYEVMERYGLPSGWVEAALETLTEEEYLSKGEYVATKSFPQWCYRPNLEEIHRLTLRRLRQEMEPAPPEVYADFLVRWQHLHPETYLKGLDGLRSAIAQLQGHETYQILFEQDLFPGRVSNYDSGMLDRLCRTGEVVWRRFDTQRLRRGQIGFAFRTDQPWLAQNPHEITQDFSEWDEDIPEQCNAVRDYLRDHGASYFDDIVAGTGLDWRYVLRAVWHLAWTGEATNDSYESIRYAEVASGLSGCYDLATRPTKKGVTLDFIVRHMLENKQLNPRLGRWAPTERLVPLSPEDCDAEAAATRWAALLIRRHGIVTKEVLKRERGAPGWRDLRRALAKQELLGEVRRGYFVEGLSGEQYAAAEAVEALRAAKLRQGRDAASDDLVLVNLYDPANPFGTLFPITDEVGNEIRQMNTPTKYLLLRGGQPILLYAGTVTLLTDLSRETVAAAIRRLTSMIDAREPWRTRTELAIRDWNGHPTRVSPARHLLVTLGFYPVDNHWRGYVYDGETFPDAESVAAAENELLNVYERHGKEEAPIVYDADWVISQAEAEIRPKVAELIAWLKARLPDACEFIYRPRYFKDFQVLYRGMRCINPHVQRKKIRLQIAHKGWTPGILIYPETDLEDGDFAKRFDAQFRKTRAQIDAVLDAV